MEYYTISDFNSSHFFVKAEEVFSFGHHVESWRYKDKFITLYAYSDFYIEITWCPKVSSITDIHAISSNKASEKYVPDTDLRAELCEVGVS